MTVSRIKLVVQETYKRRFNKTKSRKILDIYFKDAPQSGRLTIYISVKN